MLDRRKVYGIYPASDMCIKPRKQGPWHHVIALGVSPAVLALGVSSAMLAYNVSLTQCLWVPSSHRSM